MRPTEPIQVFITSRDSVCAACKKKIGARSMILPRPEQQARCMACAGLGELVFLPSGDTALTRRAKKHSPQHAIVMKWNPRRKCAQRQGLLVEAAALETARAECQADAPKRKAQQAKNAVRRGELDQEYIKAFATKIRTMYPYCPTGKETTIAEHACTKYSGRVGRSANAKELNERAVRLAVTAHIRHTETPYDHLIETTRSRAIARSRVLDQVNTVLRHWAK